MPTVVLVTIVVLGYVAMGMVTGTVVAYTDNRRHKEAMTDTEAGQLAFFTVFWPVLLVFIVVCGFGWCVYQGVVHVGKLGSGYARYLRDLGVPKQIG
jgi:hypothetical protein